MTTEALSSLPIAVDDRKTRIFAGFMRYLPLFILAALWELGSRSGLISTLALPALSTVIMSWFELLLPTDPFTGSGMLAWIGWAFSGDLIVNGADSLWRLGAGLSLAIGV